MSQEAVDKAGLEVATGAAVVTDLRETRDEGGSCKHARGAKDVQSHFLTRLPRAASRLIMHDR
jgi:hypothetical protein